MASAALFWLSGALLLCPGCSIVAGGVSITSAGAAAVLAAGVTIKAGVGASVTSAAAMPELLPTMLGTGMGPIPPPACQVASLCIISGSRALTVFATWSSTSCGSIHLLL